MDLHYVNDKFKFLNYWVLIYFLSFLPQAKLSLADPSSFQLFNFYYLPGIISPLEFWG